MSTTHNATRRISVPTGLRGVSWRTFALILAVNTGFAAILSIEDPRPFWHPFITAQCFGLSIAYAVNAISPWEKTHPVWRLVLAVALGSIVGMALVILIKGYGLGVRGYRLVEVAAEPHPVGSTLIRGFCTGLLLCMRCPFW